MTIKAGFISLVTLTLFLLPLSCHKEKRDELVSILEKHTACFNEPPGRIPSTFSVDAPLMGNGSMGVALSGAPDSLFFHLSRNDFWRLVSAHDESYPLVLGRIGLSMPALEGASYQVEQRLYDATTTARFGKGDRLLAIDSWVAATEDVLVITMANEGNAVIDGALYLALPEQGRFPEQRKQGVTEDGILYIQRTFTEDVEIPTEAAAALNVSGADNGRFSLRPGGRLTVVCTTSGNFKSDDCLQSAIERAALSGKNHLSRLRRAHEAWWADFWLRSWVHIPDPVIEKQYYLSLYGMASCSRDPDFPPSLFGGWITQEPPAWMGDYHLNYNHMAPYYALYSANRLEQARPYYSPLLAFMPRGRYYSEKVCGISDAILLPVGIGPLGIETTRWSAYLQEKHPDWKDSGNIEKEGMFWGQKSNAAYAVSNLAMQFYRTWDRDFAQEVYPFVKAVATFWEHYLTLEGDCYVIYNDAIHEGTIGTMNPIASLGLVRMVMETACDMSEFLGVDEDRRPAWKDRHDRLADYPLQEREGKTVFRYTEKGVDWWADNTLGIQHIYPAGQIGLESDPALLEVARNTIGVMHRWSDFNGTNSFFPAAVRVGFSPDSILTRLHDYALHTYPNGFQRDNPHGPENWSTVPNTVNEMMCMGHQGIVRLFPVWPWEQDASFHHIRAEGAFLVSAALHDREIADVTIVSEKGRDLTLSNPWDGQAVEITRPDGKTQLAEGKLIHLQTKPGGTYRFRPCQKQNSPTL